MLPGEALRELEPLLAPTVGYGRINTDARRIDPGAAAVALADEARAAGAEIRTGCAVRELLRRGDDVTGVLSDDGRIEAAHVVVAAGPWSWRVCRSLAHDVPVRGVRGWIIVTRPAPFRLRHAIEEEWTRPRRRRPTLGQLADGSEPEPYVPCVLQQDFAGRVLVGASLHGAIVRRRRVARDAPRDRAARGRGRARAGRPRRSPTRARASGPTRPTACRCSAPTPASAVSCWPPVTARSE